LIEAVSQGVNLNRRSNVHLWRKADIELIGRNDRFCPKADIRCGRTKLTDLQRNLLPSLPDKLLDQAETCRGFGDMVNILKKGAGMKSICTITLSTLMLSLPALVWPAHAQSVTEKAKHFELPPESIVVTATKPSDAAIAKFIEARATPTRFLNQLAHWIRPLCPATVGLETKFNQFISQRIRDVASAIGAPINSNPGCRPNVEVVFTTTPQALLDNVRKTGPAFLGFYNNSSQADELAKIARPIQAWYMTESRDDKGYSVVDRGTCTPGLGSQNTLPVVLDAAPSQDPTMQGALTTLVLNLPCAQLMHSSGWRLKSSYDSGVYNVLILAEPAKLLDYEIGSLADYIAMLTLAQVGFLDVCQDMPSVSNMLAKDCPSASNKITDADLAYLRGLYGLPKGYSLTNQRNGISSVMKKVLVTDKGGAN
jgi:hypothetical protein